MQQRYFLELAYFGKSFVGWQAQPNGRSVQSEVEKVLSIIFQFEIKVMGCGRTDTGVHASQFFLHFDGPEKLPDHFLDRINKMIGKDISFYRIIPVPADAHARFDAIQRSYTYFLGGKKDPFRKEIMTYFPQMSQLDFSQMNLITQQLTTYKAFAPFCKTNSDVKTMDCQLTRAEWIQTDQYNWEFHITSNRFLRGMVRLIVGMSLKVGLGTLSQDAVIQAMDRQKPLDKSYSAPAEGLFLSKISYPYIGK